VKLAPNRKPITELQSITCRMGSHSVSCHPTQVNVSHLNPRRTGWYSTYRPRRDKRLSWPWCWLYSTPRWFICPLTVTHPSSNHMIATRPRVKPTASWS